MKRNIALIAFIYALYQSSFLFTLNAYAESWQYIEGKGYYYLYDDGSFPVNEWVKIDENWYHFDELGYMQTGILSFDGGTTYYHLMQSGAMEVNHDYGIGFCDDNGLWHDKITELENDGSAFSLPPDNYIFFNNCRKYGIDIDLLCKSTVNDMRINGTVKNFAQI